MNVLSNSLIKTDSSNFVSLIARITLAIVILPHGLQKTLGWFGGYGFQGTLEFFTQSLGIPLILAILVIAAESLGAISLAFGFLTRFCAASIAAVMLGAVLMAHIEYGFFMNWSGSQQGEGFEYHLLILGLTLVLMIAGGGRASIDSYLSEKIS